MLSVRVYTDLPRHPKALELGNELRAPRAWTHVVELWLWAREVRPEGDLKACTDRAIAQAAGWTRGKPEAFVAALTASGFLSAERVLVNFEDEVLSDPAAAAAALAPALDTDAARAARKRAKTAERTRKWRANRPGPSSKQTDKRASPGVTGRHRDATRSLSASQTSERASHVTPSPASPAASPSVTPPTGRRAWSSRGVIGLEEQERKPRTSAALVLAHGKELQEAWSEELIPKLQLKVEGLYERWSRWYDIDGERAALARLLGCLQQDAADQRKRNAPKGAIDTNAIANSVQNRPKGRLRGDDEDEGNGGAAA